MKKNIFSFILLLVFSFNYSQSNLWTKISEEKTKSLPKMERSSMPSSYDMYSLNLNSLKQQLVLAPLASLNSVSTLILPFPNPDGSVDNYRIYDSPVMETGLVTKFPSIKTYIGKGIEDPTATIRFSVTLFGLHTMTMSGTRGTFFIDTYTKDLNNYIVYYKSNVSPSRNFKCFTNLAPTLDFNNLDINSARMSDGKYREFRLAMACTIEYAAFHITAAGLDTGTPEEKITAVLSAMTVTVARVNAIYERDLSIHLNLIANNDQLIFVDSDNFTNDDAYALIDESQIQITDIIGSANFDIGHTVSTGGGGLAGPSPCDDATKASGITGSPAPVGDPYDIDYVAHEMGHQFGANHTFNGDAGSCGGGNRNAATAIETGSGTTIMAYAGICAPQNVQNNSDALFHEISIVEINNLLNNIGCATITNNGNNAPIVNAGLDYTIPKGTAFILKGSATDADGDALTYAWEQTDKQISTQPPVNTSTSGPNYRCWLPSTSPNRYMPKLSNVIAGNLIPTWEVTPNVARVLNFALTVRDNRSPLGGQTGKDIMKVTVNGTAGPFTVTSQNTTGITWTGNSSQTITWNVAGTDANSINTANVNILLSTDSGLTFNTILLANTPNDGTEVITVPNTISSTNCRIMVEAVGNIYYAVNSKKFTIAPQLSNQNFGLDDFSLSPNPNNGSFFVKFNSVSSNPIKIVVHDIRGRLVYEKSFENNGWFSQNIQLEKAQTGFYFVTIQDGGRKEIKKIIVE